MREIHLNISGKRAIAFMGEEIAMATIRDTSRETKSRWEAVRIYEVDPEWAERQKEKTAKETAPYRVGIAKCTIWEGERDDYKVCRAWAKPEILGIVRMHVPKLDQEIADQLGISNAPIRRLEHEHRKLLPEQSVDATKTQSATELGRRYFFD